MKNLLLLTILLCPALVINAQTRKTPAKPKPTVEMVKTQPTKEDPKPTQKVVIEKLNGDKLTGLFVGGNIDSIIVDLDGSRINIKLLDIASIRFGDAPVKIDSQNNSKSNEAIANALKSLKKLSAATEVGISFQEYGKRLIDVKIEVDDSITSLPDGYVKDEIKLAMEAYTDASTAWNNMIRDDYLFPSLEPGKSLQKKYSIPIDRSIGMDLLPRNLVLSTIWAAARQHIENASKGEPSKD